jgi:carbonic anhydrase
MAGLLQVSRQVAAPLARQGAARFSTGGRGLLPKVAPILRPAVRVASTMNNSSQPMRAGMGRLGWFLGGAAAAAAAGAVAYGVGYKSPVSEVQPLRSEKLKSVSAKDALAQLREGNARFIDGGSAVRHVLKELELVKEDQLPMAVVVSCADSRILVRAIFDTGLGDLFVPRVAGNTVTPLMRESIEFGVNKGANLVVLLGHTGCGAAAGSLNAAASAKYPLTCAAFDEAKASLIAEGVTEAQITPDRLAERHVTLQVAKLQNYFGKTYPQVTVVGAMYDLRTGKVDFLE